MAHVLVVEDEAVQRDLIREVLEGAGHSVVEAGDGVYALKLLEEVHGVDLILTDYRMPGMDGLVFARQASRRDPSIPIVLVSGNADGPGDLPGEARRAGVREVLGKPWQIPELTACVWRVVYGGD